MGKKVTLENFGSEIAKILDDYGDEVSQNLDAITKKVGQKGAQLLRNESKSTFPDSQHYANKWTYKAETGRLYTTVTIYSKMPGLPHLLEYGHAIVSGGRQVGQASAFPHIAPVEEKLIKEYEQEVKSKL